MVKKCCTANSSILRYRISKNSSWQEITLAKGTYCVELISNLGGWVENVVATAPQSPYFCVPLVYKTYLNDYDPTAVYTNIGSTAATCPGNRGRTTTTRNGAFVRQPDDVVTANFTFEQSTCELVVTNKNNLKVLNLKANLLTPGNVCPIEYFYNCDSNCADGYLECKKDDYPGYCCIPCNEIKAEIKAIASQVRSINNG